MGRKRQVGQKTGPVRIYNDKKKRLGKIVNAKIKKERRYVTELEVGDEVFTAGLPEVEKKYGLESELV